jgi:hypothetical protein
MLIDFIDHGVNFIGFLDVSFEFIVEIFGDEAEEGKHEKGENHEDCDCASDVH